MAISGKRMMMTLVGGFGLLFVVACGTVPSEVAPVSSEVTPVSTFLEVKQAIAGVTTVGDVIVTGAYCTGVDVAFMKKFTAMLAEYGTHGYWEFIEQKGSPCYDTRMKRVETKYTRVTLVEKMWEFDLYEGKHYTMWTARDRHSVMGYTWTTLEGQET